MPAPVLMVLATLLFATMGVCVKLASASYAASEIVMYRGLVGLLMTALLCSRRRISLKTTLPGMHLWRSISGVSALCLWFFAIGGLPLATAMTLNYMSSVWMALFLLGGAVLMGAQRGVPAAQSMARVGPGRGAGKARGGRGLVPATTSNAACARARANPEGRGELRHPAALPVPCVAPATPRHLRLAEHRNSPRRGPRSAPQGLLDWRLMAAVLLGFAGVALILRPTLDQQQLWHGLAGLLSGILSAMAYLQVTALGRAGEPELRVVFYFSAGGCIAGAVITALTQGGLQGHTLRGAGLLLAVGVLATTAQLCLTRAYGTGRPLVNACLQYLGIVFSFIYGMLLFDDALTWQAGLGILLIIGAGLAATLLRARVAPPTRDSQFNPAEP